MTDTLEAGWQPNGLLSVGHDVSGEFVLVGVAGHGGNLVRLTPDQASNLATAIKSVARKLQRRVKRNGEGS